MHIVPGEIDPAVEIFEPAQGLGQVVFSSPHSGKVYPRRFLEASRLDALTLRRSEDAFVDELFAGVVARGSALIRAHFPRAFLDVNREPYELDPRMFSGRLPPFANTRSVRVAGGLGTIARVVSETEEIYAGPLQVDEALDRIERYHKPYHRALRGLAGRAKRAVGSVLVVDCHSMPSQARLGDKRQSDFVLGDRYGTSCAAEVSDRVQESLEQLGYTVSRNKPYAGGYITEQYGQPHAGFHALQIEICRSLYMDERRCVKTGGFAWLSADLMKVADALRSLGPLAARPRAEAAE